MTLPTAPPDLSRNQLLDRAAGTPLTRPAIRSLAASAPPANLLAAFAEALPARGPHAATVLGFAAAAAGEKLPAAAVLAVLPELDDIAHLTGLVGACGGDRVEMLLDLVERGRASWQREALALFLATELLAGDPPPRLLARLRSLAREPLGAETACLVVVAAHTVGDPALHALVAERFPPMSEPLRQRMRSEMRRASLDDPLADLPEREPPRIVSGYTVVRTAPKIGRNDACPCGSGRKYKKCCAGKESAAPPEASIADQFERLDDAHADVRRQLFELLRPSQLAEVELARLTALQLIQGMRKLLQYHRWEDAERFAGAIDARDDLPGGGNDAGGYFLEIADDALEAGELEVAERCFARARADEQERAQFTLALALARRTPDALERLDAVLARALRQKDSGAAIGCAYSVLDHLPALGVFVARGCLDPARDLDSELLLESIERVRDRLMLDPEEPWWEVFDLLVHDRRGREERAQVGQVDARERARLEAEVERLRGELAGAGALTRDLEARMQRHQRDLSTLASERERLAQRLDSIGAAEHSSQTSTLEAERQRLRAKIDQLKGEISAGAAQRSELRRELSRLTDRLEVAPEKGATPATNRSRADEKCGEGMEEEPTASPVAAPRGVLVPVYAPPAIKSVAALPKSVAAHILQTVTALATADERAWHSVKRMRATSDVYSARAGRSHRVLFRFAAGRLDVLEVIDRKDLDLIIGRLAT